MYRQQCTYPARRIVLILFLEQIPLHSSHLMELKKIALPVCSYSTCTMTEKIALFHPCRRVKLGHTLYRPTTFITFDMLDFSLLLFVRFGDKH